MNNRKKAAIILLVVLVIYTGAMIIFAYPWEKFPDNFTEAKDGVVMISTEKGSGSGFAIGKSGEPVEYIVTNCHVVFNDSNKAHAYKNGVVLLYKIGFGTGGIAVEILAVFIYDFFKFGGVCREVVYGIALGFEAFEHVEE